MDLPIRINRDEPISLLGVLGGIIHFPNKLRPFCKLTVQILINVWSGSELFAFVP